LPGDPTAVVRPGAVDVAGLEGKGVTTVENDNTRIQGIWMSMYSLSTVMFPGLSVEEIAARTAGAGFRCAELASEEHAEEFLAHPGRIRRQFELAGVIPRSVHCPPEGWNNAAADPAERKKSVEAAAASFWAAAEVGAEIVVCHANKPSGALGPEQYEESKARSVESLAILAELARKAGIKMAVENLPARGVRRPSSSVQELLAMIERLGDHVGICVDAGHSNVNGCVAAEDARAAGKKLFVVHIQDNDGTGEDQHLLPGRGSTDWETFVRALDEMRFEGPRTFEVNVSPEDIDAALAEVARLRARWDGR